MQGINSNDTYELGYYDRRYGHQTVSMRKDEEGNLVKINQDGTKSDMLELKGDFVSEAPIPCEIYSDMKNMKSGYPVIGWNNVFHESFDLMEDYYSGRASAEDVSAYIRKVCRLNNASKAQISETLGTMYEYMSRANTRNAVENNLNEAERLFIEAGMKEDTADHFSNRKGGIYYNADHYYACENIQEIIKKTINELSEQYGVDQPDYAELDKSTRFPDGGITYNGVWNQKTYQLIHYHEMPDTEFIDNGFVPSKSFLYCEVGFLVNDTVSSETIVSDIKEYISGKLGRNLLSGRNNLLLEFQKRGLEAGSHNEKRNRIHNYMNENGIPVKNTADRLWLSDYFGFVML